mmetsp:Transcript_47350/g.118230  ORF Transcript_47350/g.118230 Transcript_47350/m.118230 type:complete len:254 (-) Transcript_47350:312-1073(-)
MVHIHPFIHTHTNVIIHKLTGGVGGCVMLLSALPRRLLLPKALIGEVGPAEVHIHVSRQTRVVIVSATHGQQQAARAGIAAGRTHVHEAGAGMNLRGHSTAVGPGEVGEPDGAPHALPVGRPGQHPAGLPLLSDLRGVPALKKLGVEKGAIGTVTTLTVHAAVSSVLRTTIDGTLSVADVVIHVERWTGHGAGSASLELSISSSFGLTQRRQRGQHAHGTQQHHSHALGTHTTLTHLLNQAQHSTQSTRRCDI